MAVEGGREWRWRTGGNGGGGREGMAVEGGGEWRWRRVGVVVVEHVFCLHTSFEVSVVSQLGAVICGWAAFCFCLCVLGPLICMLLFVCLFVCWLLCMCI